MDFDLDDDQQALAGAARDLLSGLASPERVRAHISSGAPYDADLWAAMVDQGWASIEHPADRDGLGLGFVESALLLEECGAAAAPVPLAPTVLAAHALLAGGLGDWADRLASGSALGCVDVRTVGLVAEPGSAGHGARVHGTTAPVVGAPVADIAVVLAADHHGDTGVYAVEIHPASRPASLDVMDVTRGAGRLELDRAAATRLGGADAADVLVDRQAVAASALLLGGSRRALELAVAHAKDREQFGKPIGSFQAVKHRCADMLVDLEGMRSAVLWASWSVGASAPDASTAASTAAVWCADASRRIMTSALQVHGGIGFTWEHDLHLFVKRAQLDRWSTGGADRHRDRLAVGLRSRVAAGQPVIG